MLRYPGVFLLLFLICAVLHAEEPAGCPLDPALVNVAAQCEEGQVSEDLCLWIPVLESLAAERLEDAVSRLEKSFEMPRKRASRLLEAIGLFHFILVDFDCLMEGGTSFILKSLGVLNQLQEMQGHAEPILFFGHLFDFDSAAFENVRARDRDPDSFDAVHRACRMFVELLELAGLKQFLMGMADGSPLAPGRSGTPAPGGPWSSDLAHLTPLLERVDEVLNRASSRSVEETRAALDEVISTAGDPLQKGMVLARAGAGFALSTRNEDALAYLQKAIQTLELVDDSVGQALRQTAQVASLHLLKAMERPADAQAIEEELQEAELPPLIELLLSQELSEFMEVTPETLIPALPIKGMGRIFDAMISGQFSFEELQPTFQAFEILFPGVSGASPKGPLVQSGPTRPTFDVMGLLTAGKEDEALERLDRLIDEHPSVTHAWLAVAIADWTLRRKDYETTLAALDRAIDLVEREVQDSRVAEMTRSIVDLLGQGPYLMAVNVSFLNSQPERAFQYAERGRAYSTRQLAGDPGFTVRGSVPSAEERRLEKEIVRLVQDPKSSDSTELQQRFATARLERQLAQVGPKAPRPVDHLDLNTIQSILEPGETLISYFFGGSLVNVWMLTKDNSIYGQGPWTEVEAQGLNCILSGIRSPHGFSRGAEAAEGGGATLAKECGVKDEVSDATQLLHQWFVAPLLEGIAPGGRLIFAPHGPLHRVPWGTLRNAKGRRLLDDFEVAVIPSSGLLHRLRSRQQAVSKEAKDTALVLGDPTSHLTALPAARYEAAAVAELLDVEPLLGEKATESSVYRAAPHASVLHVAAHGIYEPQAPLFSRLQLAKDAENDGFLHLHEIWDRLDLRRNRLVVLSACETASGEPTRSDDIVGLTQAFLVAGSPAVIATLWPVDDPASALLMRAFYQAFQSGMTAGRALRTAQLELSQKKEYAAPYYWAGFVLVGDPETRWEPTSRPTATQGAS